MNIVEYPGSRLQINWRWSRHVDRTLATSSKKIGPADCRRFLDAPEVRYGLQFRSFSASMHACAVVRAHECRTAAAADSSGDAGCSGNAGLGLLVITRGMLAQATTSSVLYALPSDSEIQFSILWPDPWPARIGSRYRAAIIPQQAVFAANEE
jgi:hypothetical protein